MPSGCSDGERCPGCCAEGQEETVRREILGKGVTRLNLKGDQSVVLGGLFLGNNFLRGIIRTNYLKRNHECRTVIKQKYHQIHLRLGEEDATVLVLIVFFSVEKTTTNLTLSIAIVVEETATTTSGRAGGQRGS